MQHEQRIQAPRLAVALAATIVVALVTSMQARAHAQAEAERAGNGVDALAGVYDVPLAVRNAEGLNARLGFGYGWTEPVLKMNDTHHRLQFDAAGSITPLSWLSAALRVLGRYDIHSGGVNDSGFVTETHFGARATVRLGADVRAGADLSFWLPSGDTVGDAFSALSGDLRLLLAYAPELSPLTLGLVLGLRIDRSKYAGGDPRDYSPSDRLALGVSDAIFAAREGIAVSYRTGSIEWVAEWAFTMYFAHVAESPMWIRAGARYRPSQRLQLELLLGVSPSKRPSLAEGAPLAVIEPRLAAGLSATYAWSTLTPPPSAAAVRVPEPTQPPQQQEPAAQLRGQVSTPSGAELSGATLTLSRGAARMEATSDARGAFMFAALPAGEYALRVSAKGFTPDEQSLDLHDGAAIELHVTLKRELPQGQIRGTVRRFNGAPVVASIALAQLGITQQTREDGTFEIDVPPGEYSVAVKARGFRSQVRKARVEEHGVAILVVELEVAK